MNPWLFYSGKIASYICWALIITNRLGLYQIGSPPNYYLDVGATIITWSGLLIFIISLVDLGGATRLGLPSGQTKLRTNGLYRFSRNPMYVSFIMLTLSSMLINFHLTVWILGIYGIVTHHRIILAEESFLKNRFGKEYIDYLNRVRRYI